ncbi:hypothetical protein PUNSTDRAFT_103581 [Punctularia strigosozonata HHB-11173 SS5]|uniref:uncharacterized protein n=1 Tax=Punctularia strigosozonata (strain HHB-11173) TaxID=741275 RepID=UPI0004416651|nr:uncharacterized protein PUNSTDRAFT_103581 [Punctularia strigosozonata HHB-11173 SS5]EIN07565.1 hypothetical protein PUNSTDRAFT_103581 [Punctularia strigosozonata HHB-11173 SS5]
MAYNREWDRGKDNWNDESWNGGPSHARQREDEYYGDGKRRKFNNGGYDAQSHEGEGNYGTGHDYHDYSDRAYRGGGQGKKRMAASEPSPHVIFLGLDPDFTEADFQAFMTEQGCTIETVTIIRDRSTGASKGFGFAQFPTTEHARAFVDPQFPFIQLPPPASHGASAKAAYKSALDAGMIPSNGRRVKIDYSQSVNPSDRPRRPQNSNDGTRDIGNTQSPLLLFRGLDPLSGPQAIAQAMKYSSGPGKEGAKGMRRIILIKDKNTLASWGFAFVEFVDVESSSAVLAATMNPQVHPTGFRISDRPVAASFAQIYSFQLVDAMHRDEACIASTSVLGGIEGGWVRYWDEHSTIAVLEFEVKESAKATTNAPAKEKKKKTKKEDDLIPLVPEASALPVSDKPVTLSFGKAGGTTTKLSLATNKKQSAVSPAVNLAEDAGAEDGDEEEQIIDPSAAKVIAARKVAPMIASKKVVNNINKWNQVQETLSQPGTSSINMVQPMVSTADTATPAPTVQPAVKAITTADASTNELEYADPTARICLLCARQFKTTDLLKRHSKESELHKKNLQDPNLCEVARGKARNARKSTTPDGSPGPQEQPKYRDRALERRIMHNQPDVPLPDAPQPAKKRSAEGPPPPPSPPPPPKNPGEDANNVGNKLLKMMGWKEGTGLGTSGEGRVDPIQTAIYAQGVGLGASKGQEVGKYEPGYTGYLHKAQDAARERYNNQ